MTYILKRAFCSAVLGLWLSSVSALEANVCAGGIVHGSGWAFLVASPEGWCMALDSGLPVNSAFFQIKSKEQPTPSSSAPPTFMYMTLSKKDQNDPNLASLIAHDEEAFRQTSPNLKITAMSPLNTSDKKPAKVRQFEGGQGERCEIVAYKEYDALMYKIVISAPSCAQLEMHRDSFAQLVGSISNFDGGVQLQGAKQK